jgi:ClpP class serine protease
MTVEERKIYMDEVVRSYDQFKQIVAAGRDLPVEDLDPVCEGRVWTGRQALARELVDSHGDFVEAIKKAAELGGLPVDDDHAIAVANLFAKGDGYILPRPYDEVQELGRLLSGERLRELSARPVWLLPYQVTVR